MRLINYGAGEITDRLTILALKILYGDAATRPVKHFEDERAALLSKLAGRTLNGSWFKQVLELGAVNAALWQAEDRLRRFRQARDPHGGEEEAEIIIAVAFRIQELNDQRSTLIEAINQLTGEHLGEEKLT